jgi:hypothetical protein
MAKEPGKPISEHVSDEIAQSPIRGALRGEDIDILNEVYGGLSIETAVQRFKANRVAQGFVTNEAMLHEFRNLAQRVERGPRQTGSVTD